MIPIAITRSHLLNALDALTEQTTPAKRASTRYDLIHAGNAYPPKEVVRQAAALAGLPLGRFWGGRETNAFLRSRGFVVIGKSHSLHAVTPLSEDEEQAFPEGAAAYRLHLRYERNATAARIAKERRLAAVGDLCCDACGFSFSNAYGERGAGFIEAHHNRPVSELSDGGTTRPSELALVCSNCHRMLHRFRPWLVVEDLKALLRTEQPGDR